MTIPTVSLEGVETDPRRWAAAAEAIDRACRTSGFFSVVGYSMPDGLEDQMDREARVFFRLPPDVKAQILMTNGGRAWRGYFPVGGEFTSGKPDIKEGIYFGEELAADHVAVKNGLPLHGGNLFPSEPAALRDLVLQYMSACKRIADLLIQLVATGLGLDREYFLQGISREPLQLFRIFHYPPVEQIPEALRADASLWGVGEHTDYGLLTLLKQDSVGGLEVKSLEGEWMPVPPQPRTLVINIGDILEAITYGLYRSTPHRVRNTNPTAMRLSFPYFYDPGFESVVEPLPLTEEQLAQAREANERRERNGVAQRRWDNADVARAQGSSYGSYLVEKVSKVFPALAAAQRIA